MEEQTLVLLLLLSLLLLVSTQEEVVSENNHVSISTLPSADADGIVGYCPQSGDEVWVETTCRVPVCYEENLDYAVPPRLLLNDTDLSQASQVELVAAPRSFPSNCSIWWRLRITLRAEESLRLRCSQQGGRLTSGDVVLQSGVRWCKEHVTRPISDVTDKMEPTTAISHTNSTMEAGGGSNGSTSAPEHSSSDVHIIWVAVLAAFVLVVGAMMLCALALCGIVVCLRRKKLSGCKSHATAKMEPTTAILHNSTLKGGGDSNGSTNSGAKHGRGTQVDAFSPSQGCAQLVNVGMNPPLPRVQVPPSPTRQNPTTETHV